MSAIDQFNGKTKYIDKCILQRQMDIVLPIAVITIAISVMMLIRTKPLTSSHHIVIDKYYDTEAKINA